MSPPVYLRKNVYEKLQEFIQDIEKDGYTVKLYDAYRSLEEQQKSWNIRLEQTKKEFPNSSEKEIIRITSLKVANPEDKQNVGGHQTGAAIDVTLVKNGKEINMGTKYEEYGPKTITENKFINKEEKQNREYMKKKLEKVGFSNFPAEWWHFSYGDKMWAAYNGKKKAIYGYIESDK